jgi:hypothetical protein
VLCRRSRIRFSGIGFGGTPAISERALAVHPRLDDCRAAGGSGLGGTDMKIGIRIPSLKKRIAARTSPARILRHNLGLKAPRGFGWVTNPRRALYNRIYSRTTRGIGCAVWLLAGPLALIAIAGVYLA